MDFSAQRTEHTAAMPFDGDFAVGWYYEAEPETAENLRLMRLIDEQYTRTPFYGIRKMGWWLGEQGHAVNAKRVRRLMRQMGLEAIYPKPRLSVPGTGHKIYPYRLGSLKIDRPDHVWASDITYIRLRRGFVYLVAIMDWFSRYVLAWEVSISLESAFCVAALDWALTTTRPEIFNNDCRSGTVGRLRSSTAGRTGRRSVPQNSSDRGQPFRLLSPR